MPAGTALRRSTAVMPVGMAAVVGGVRKVKFGTLELTGENAGNYLILKITAKKGIHARPAAALVAMTFRSSAEIRIHRADGKFASVKDVLKTLELKLGQGQIAVISFEGSAAAKARDAVRLQLETYYSERQEFGPLLTFDELAEKVQPT